MLGAQEPCGNTHTNGWTPQGGPNTQTDVHTLSTSFCAVGPLEATVTLSRNWDKETRLADGGSYSGTSTALISFPNCLIFFTPRAEGL